jgi:3-deoxy-D-manno-octulosonic-acid transferase
VRPARRNVVVSGNLKFDMAPIPAQVEAGKAWRLALGRPVVLAAVTREGEEAALVAAWTKRPSPRPLLLVVPRHPQRFDEVAGLLQDAGLRFARRSEWRDGQGRMQANSTPCSAIRWARWRSTTARPMSPCSAAASRRSEVRT